MQPEHAVLSTPSFCCWAMHERFISSGTASLGHLSASPPLPPAALEASLAHLSSAQSLHDSSFFQRLRAGKPVSVGVLGASVAQQGGCLEQPGQRCMLSSRRGYYVRAFKSLNLTWPNADHQLHNGAVDATPAQMFLSCLLPLLPATGPHLVFLEFGSMARALRGHFAEMEMLVRRLLGLPSRPLLVFTTVPSWSTSPVISRVIL